MSAETIARLEERLSILEAAARQQPIQPDGIYTPAEVASLLRCGKSNVYELLTGGELAVIKVGAGNAGLRVLGSDLLAFLGARKTGGPKPKGSFKHLKGFA